MSSITTHVLDTSLGRPAVGVAVALYRLSADLGATKVGGGTTDDDGRIRALLPAGATLDAGDYRLHFDTGGYFARDGRECFYPAVDVTFRIAADAHYHVPLLLNPYGYSTYRGS
jgi:5-hydroxyisourate hydrolase